MMNQYYISFLYSTIGILGIIFIHILNFKYFSLKEDKVGVKEYKFLLRCIIGYMFSDALWGLFNILESPFWMVLDTTFVYIFLVLIFYAIANAGSTYMRVDVKWIKILKWTASLIVVAQLVLLAVNLFHPIYFWIDIVGNIHYGLARYVMLTVIMFMYLNLSTISLAIALRTGGSKRVRFRATYSFAVIMTLSLLGQLFFPNLPFYSMGLVVGTTVVHVFVHENAARHQMQKIHEANEKLTLSQNELARTSSELEDQVEEISTLNCQMNLKTQTLKKLYEEQSRYLCLINSLSKSYLHISVIDLANGTLREVNPSDESDVHFSEESDANQRFEETSINIVASEFRKEWLVFTNLKTLPERMKNTDYIAFRYYSQDAKWCRGSFVCNSRDKDGNCTSVLWCVRNINEEKAREDLLQANIAANQAKTKFLQNMSHEIRTPLNAMFGFAQLLGMPDGSWTDEEKETYNKYVLNSFSMMDLLISDILDSADSQHGNFRVNMADVYVNEVCRNAMILVEFRRPGAVEMKFTTELEDDYKVTSDARRIQQVLVNYLTNACKFTLQGEIHLHCSKSEHPGKLTFSVTDTGKGVPLEKADEIFGRFTKLNPYVQGSGLGLNICQTIATKLDGEVYLDTSYTGGARFVFDLNVAS